MGDDRALLTDDNEQMEAMPGIEPGIRALQAPALPLGHIAACNGALAPGSK